MKFEDMSRVDGGRTGVELPKTLPCAETDGLGCDGTILYKYFVVFEGC